MKVLIKNIIHIVLYFCISIACLSIEANYAILNSAFAEFYIRDEQNSDLFAAAYNI